MGIKDLAAAIPLKKFKDALESSGTTVADFIKDRDTSGLPPSQVIAFH